MIPFRDENPTRRFPLVVVGLIAANVIVQVYQWLLGPDQGVVFRCTYGVIPAVLLGRASFTEAVSHAYTLELLPRGMHVVGFGTTVAPLDPIWLTVLSSMFLHGGIVHLAGNMLYLWIFGNNVEDVLGHVRFLVFYVFCGAVAAGAQILMSLHSLAPMIGASGAIAGVLGAYYVKFPRARVQCLVFLFFFVTVVMVPAKVVLLLWFLLQVWYSLEPGAIGGQGGVAVFAHIGGFLAGWALVRRFEPRRRRRVLVGW